MLIYLFTTLLAGLKVQTANSIIIHFIWIDRISFKNQIRLRLTRSPDLNHKPEIETESEIPQDRHGLKQPIKILGNGDNALYRLGEKMYLLERIDF